MKVFRKGNSQREFRQSFKSQSAMEYLMTYGWAILIIAVVLAALFELGVFNPMTFAPKASPGSCQVVRPEGAGTTNFISLEGECQGELPQYVASLSKTYISLPAQVTSSLTSFTASVWFSTTNTNGWNATVSFKNSSNDGWELRVACPICGGGGDGVGFRIDTSAVVNQGANDNSKDVDTGSWNFEAMTFNYSTKVATIYLDGGQSAVSVTITGNIPTVTTIGGIGLGIFDDNFGGQLANVQIYNTPLSANDIQTLYQEGIGGGPIKIQNLVGWWPLNGNANDYSGNGNNGVPTSGVSYTNNWYSGYSAP